MNDGFLLSEAKSDNPDRILSFYLVIILTSIFLQDWSPDRIFLPFKVHSTSPAFKKKFTKIYFKTSPAF